MADPFFSPVGQNAASVNFFQNSPEVATDVNALQRQRALAALLSKQGLQGQEGQMVSGHYIPPSALSYVNQLGSAALGGYLNREADSKEQKLAQAMMASRQKDASDFMSALNGAPAQAREVAGPAAEGQAAPTQTTAAVPGDVNRAMAIAMQSQNPLVSGMAPELMKRQMDAAELQSALQAAGLSPQGGGDAAPIAGSQGAPVQAGFPAQGGTPGMTGLPPGVSPQAVALTLSKNAQANKLGTMFQEASKPNVLAEGGAIGRYNAQGQWVPDFVSPKTEAGIGVSPVPGQPGQFQANPVAGYGAAKADIAGQVAGSEARARDPYSDMVTVNTPKGPVSMTRAQQREMAGGTPGMQGPQGPTNAAERNMAAQVAQIPFDPAREAAQVRETLATPGAIIDPKDKVQAQQYLQKLEGMQSSGGMASGGASNPAGAQSGGPQVGIPLQKEESQAYATARAKSYAEMAPKLQQGGQDAASTLRNLSTLETLYKDPNVAKGALAENISGLKNIGASFGIDMKGLSSEQAAEAITNKMALASRSTAEGGGMPGAMSDSDRKFLAGMQPGLTKTPEGRAQIIDASRKVAQRQIDVSNMARQYEMQNGQLDIGFDKALADYSAKNQMFTQPTRGGGSKTDIQGLLNKYR